MTVAQAMPFSGVRRSARAPARSWDLPLLAVAAALLGLGLIMVASASITMADRQVHEPFYYLQRQLVFSVLGIAAGVVVAAVRSELWQRMGPVLLLFALLLLVLVLVPGVGREVNGSVRWLPLGMLQFQVSELAKLLLVVYLAGYLVRRNEEVRTTTVGFLKPVFVLAIACVLLLLEPDFGAAVVLLVSAFGMMYLAGVRLWQFLVLSSLAGAVLAALVFLSPYRWTRVISFRNPWADPYDNGFQLAQSLIAFGRGEWFGVGLGESVQKLFYLPEAHTDFLYAVMGEELGLIGTVSVILLFGLVVLRACMIGARAERNGYHFSAFVAYGLGLWIGAQAFINIGVNMGVLPTKGLTLPLMSYGGSSMVVTCIALGLLLRISHENYEAEHSQAGVRDKP